MMNLRQGRWPRWCLLPQGAIRFTAAAAFGLELGVGLLLPGVAVAMAMVPSRNHKPLPTRLHASSVAPSTVHSVGKHAKRGAALVRTQESATTHGHAKGGSASHTGSTHSGNSHASAATTGTHGSAAKRNGKKGKRQRDEEAEPVLPMFHARGKTPLDRGHAHGAYAQPVKGRASGRGAPAGQSMRFPVLSTPSVHSREHHEAAQEFRSARAVEPALPPVQPVSHRHDLSSAPAAVSVPHLSAATRQEVYAQGVSHPDDDERLPRVQNAPEDDGEAPEAPAAAPVVRIAAPLPGSAVMPNARTPLVQGFGGEVAVPPNAAPATDRPGGTRRRSHPSNWQPDAMLTQPEPLEEREAMLDAAVSPAVLPEVYDRGGHFVMPAPLRGSRDVLVHQNIMALNDGLEKIYDDATLDRMRAAHRLVAFPASESLRVNPDLPSNRRLARPWTVAFAREIARAFYEKFHEPLQVNSAVRTVRYQAHLQLVNGNAAGIYGEAASPHLTGQAIDLAKRGMSQAELAWMRDTLLPLMRSGKIDVEEEFQQACFHISVYRSYSTGRRTAQVAQVQGSGVDAADENATDR